MNDIILTWPKKRSLDSYLKECEKAAQMGRIVGYSAQNRPRSQRGDRSYMVHDGAIRGWLEITQVISYESHSPDFVDPSTGKVWRGGGRWIIVRNPVWHRIEPIPMKGFRGFRYTERHCSVCHTMAGNLIKGACYDCCKVCTICNENPAYPSKSPICDSCDLIAKRIAK